MAGNLNKSTISNRQLTKELAQAEDQVASLLRQLNDLSIKNEEFQRKEAINQENQKSKWIRLTVRYIDYNWCTLSYYNNGFLLTYFDIVS